MNKKFTHLRVDLSLARSVDVEDVVLAAQTGVHGESKPAVLAVYTGQEGGGRL